MVSSIGGGGMDRLCVGCGIIIDRPFWLCQTCEDQFGVEGVPYQFWPPYLKWLVLDQKREERWGSKPVISLEAYLETGVIEPEPDRDALLAYAPYADEEANRAYRQACGIEERGE
jgi:hypothetical protein